jgi:ABC-2 type transport system ATP-binding protein
MGGSGPTAPLSADPPTAPRSHRIELTAVSSGYHGKRVLEAVTVAMEEPAIYVVLGPNGAGKTTLFRTIAGILEPISGTVRVDGIDIDRPEARTRLHYLSHIDGIPDGLRVEEALRFYATVEGAGPAEVERVVRLLGIEELRTRFFSELSQGQKKRVSIARVFLQERGIYLLDEPTSNLDPAMAKEVRDLLLEFSERKIVLYSSHNLFEAKEIGTFLILIKGGRLQFYDRIENLRMGSYRVGIKARGDVASVISAPLENGYHVVTVKSPDDVGEIVKKLVNAGVVVTEVKELDNPLEALFTGG